MDDIPLPTDQHGAFHKASIVTADCFTKLFAMSSFAANAFPLSEAVTLDLFACLHDGLSGDLAMGSRILEYRMLGLQRSLQQLQTSDHQSRSTRPFVRSIPNDLVQKSVKTKSFECDWTTNGLFRFNQESTGDQDPAWPAVVMDTIPTIGLGWLRQIDTYIGEKVSEAFGDVLESEIGWLFS